MKPDRDPSLDALRGLAIVAMVFGHLAIEVVRPPGSFYIEALGGLAPALFLTIAGMLMARVALLGRASLRKAFVRCGQLLLAGALLDALVWRIVPFTSVDILYLIGVSLPAAYLAAAYAPMPLRWVLAALFLGLAPLLQGWLGYSDYPTEYMLFTGERVDVIDLVGVGEVTIQNQTSILHHWIVDGWFPIFPWVGFALLGAAWAGVRWPGEGLRTHRFGALGALLPGLVLVAVAVQLGWMDVDYELTLRRRYGGAFMPPGWDYLVGSVGQIAILFFLVDLQPELWLWRPARLVGRHALLIYLSHFPAIQVLAFVLDRRVSDPVYLALFAGLLTLLCALAWGVERLQERTAARRRASAPAPSG